MEKYILFNEEMFETDVSLYLYNLYSLKLLRAFKYSKFVFYLNNLTPKFNPNQSSYNLLHVPEFVKATVFLLISLTLLY